jgi:Immunoglobulin V-set domain
MTIGLFTFVSDPRVSVEYNKRSAEWCLIIHDVRHSDQGLYKCQVNTKDDQYNYYNILLHIKSM